MAPSALEDLTPKTPTASAVRSRLFKSTPSLSEFQALCSQTTDAQDYPLASSIESNIPIYDGAEIDVDSNPDLGAALQDEWNHVLHAGPGVLVIKRMYRDMGLLQTVNDVFQQIIDEEKASAKGDHFAAGGKNDRIWNAFEKHGVRDPASFVDYYRNPLLALVCEAWLGPAYRITAQVNVVKPGGAAQIAHRDYHLGFQTAEASARFPIQMQVASQLLTLQGAVAHTDMPVASGPTKLLPFSQRFAAGFAAYRRDDFRAFFEARCVQLPLARGDSLWFSPALFHAAGANSTPDFPRAANLLQVSSAFGKPMETVDTARLAARCWPALRALFEREGHLSREVRAAVQAVAEGYPFPTNLDRRQPTISGMAPESEQDVCLRALQEGWTDEKVTATLRQMKLDAASC